MTPLDLNGKRFAITGTLPIVRAEATAKLESLGGIYKTRVTLDTDFLIVGTLHKVSNKLARAKAFQQAGYSLVILDGAAVFA